MSTLARGQIVEAEVLDPQGHNPKRRPVVIITATAEINPSQPFYAVAITSTLPTPITDEFVLLPWDPARKARTGLNKRAAAKCDWLLELRQEDVICQRGVVPGTELLAILEKVDRLT